MRAAVVGTDAVTGVVVCQTKKIMAYDFILKSRCKQPTQAVIHKISYQQTISTLLTKAIIKPERTNMQRGPTEKLHTQQIGS